MRMIIAAIVAALFMFASPAFAQHYHHGGGHDWRGWHGPQHGWHDWRGDRVGPMWDQRFNRGCWTRVPPLIGPWVWTC